MNSSKEKLYITNLIWPPYIFSQSFATACKMFWCMTCTTQMVFTIVMIIYIFILFVNIFTFSFSLFHIIMSLLVTKCVFEFSL